MGIGWFNELTHLLLQLQIGSICKEENLIMDAAADPLQMARSHTEKV
jgi:hypothetical protein